MRTDPVQPHHGADPPAAAIDPEEVELHEGTYRFRHNPLTHEQRALLGDLDHINGNPLDWALALDPRLDEALIAVRDPSRFGDPVWYHKQRRLREETFTSPLAQLPWRPEARLVRKMLAHTPYVIVLQEEDTVRHAFDLRTIEDPRRFHSLLVSHRASLLPATGGYTTQETHLQAMVVRVPFNGTRFARSTRKRFRLRVPGGRGDATVEATAARILSANGHDVESPRLLVALYRLLVGEVIAYWWRDPVRMESIGSPLHYPPRMNPFEATIRGIEAVESIQQEEGPPTVKNLGETIIKTGKRPPTYRRYINRLARLAHAFGPSGLAGTMEGILRGHGAHNADLVATHPALQRPLLVEVKSTGDRVRPSQAEAALYHERDGRAAYRIMRVEHTIEKK